MNISNINVSLKGEDLLSIYKEFLSIKEINIDYIKVKEDIQVVGSFTKGISIKFNFRFKVSSMEDDLIKGEIVDFKILNISIPSFLRKVALNFVLKYLKDKGIIYKDGKVIIQYKYLLKDIKYIDFDIYNIEFKDEALNVDLKNIVFSLNGELKKEVELISFDKENINNVNKEEINKVEDYYTKGREKLSNKLDIKYKDYIFIVPDIIALIYRLLKDKRVSIKSKIAISSAALYITVKKDFIKDKILFFGKLDDISIAIFALNIIIKDIPLNIIMENWEGKSDLLIVFKNAIEYATNFTNAKNIDNIYRVMDEILSV